MDYRDNAGDRRWWKSINKSKRTAIIEIDGEDVEVEVEFEVCPCCKGSATHVNPSIDSHGISAEEFNEDPEFAEDYRSGIYDVACYECQGASVVPKPLDSKILTKIEEDQQGLREMRAEQAAEARMGA